ncbi:MAG: addiction module protein [Alteromonadaceae bacterium]|nr:addiction module protein [Alteromonadaceae bacterium]
MNLREAIETTRELNSNDKALLAHCLISSLELTQDENIDNAWAELSEKRYTEMTSGSVEAVSWVNIKKSVRG